MAAVFADFFDYKLLFFKKLYKNMKFEELKKFKEVLKDVNGVYEIVNIVNQKRYIGSTKDLFGRLICGHYECLKKHVHYNIIFV
jgi:hypothetical protein